MRARGLSQAELARTVGVADAQVSRWRRGQVVPSVRYLQKIADTLDVPRARLDALAGYPAAQLLSDEGAGDPEREAHEVTFRRLLEHDVPRDLWSAYVRACETLAHALTRGYAEALAQADPNAEPRRQIGFQP